ncbi:MAG: hypothetical protein ACK4TJ_05380 [Tabrizicola sp.]
MRGRDDAGFDDLARSARHVIAEVLAAIEDCRSARRRAEGEELSEAGEYLALKALTDAEDRLIAAVMVPDFSAFQRRILSALVDILEGRG